VEASPVDKIGKIACYSIEPAAQRRETWREMNLLGEILTEVRDKLMSDEIVETTEETKGQECSHLLSVGLSISPVTVFGLLQRKLSGGQYLHKLPRKIYITN